jgi:hypothetical protein
MKSDMSSLPADKMALFTFLTDDEANTLGVNAYPTMFKIGGDGKPVESTKVVGYGGLNLLLSLAGAEK